MQWIALLPEPTPSGTPDTLTDPLTALGWQALRFTPKVAKMQGVIVLEVSASARLWGGLPQLVCQLTQSNQTIALSSYAQGATSLIAIARLTAPTAAVDDLPLRTLAAAQPHADTLARMGIATWGQLRALPRGGISRRFGAALLGALDRAYGSQPEIYPWLMLPEVFEASVELSAQVEQASALLFAACRLLAQLRVWLQLRHQGVLALELIWQMDERRHTAHQGRLLLRTAQATQDMSHLKRLLSEHLAQVQLPAPVHTLCLRSAEVTALIPASHSLLPDEVPSGHSLQHTVERLSARLGASAVLQLQVQLDHRPERMQSWHGFTSENIATTTYFKRARGINRSLNLLTKTNPDTPQWAQASTPTWLLEVPLRLHTVQQCPQYMGALTLLQGPHRIETGWWDSHTPALRDYYVARSLHTGLLWIYRERLPSRVQSHPSEPSWYLHGLFA